MHTLAGTHRRELDAGHHLHSELGAGRERLREPLRGVVVGDRHDLERPAPSEGDCFSRRKRAVGVPGVDVQVDPGHERTMFSHEESPLPFR